MWGVDCRVVSLCAGLDRSGLSVWLIVSMAGLGTVIGRLRGCLLLRWFRWSLSLSIDRR